MKHLSLIMMVMLFFAKAKASTYYFSSLTGDDSRTILQAQDSTTPWKTITQLNLFFPNLNPGDSVLFKSGEIFDGGFQITQSGLFNLPIVIASYGNSSKPVINGLTTLSGWTASGGGIWESRCPSCGTNVNTVLINSIPQAMGRYPNSNSSNKGYLTIDSHNGNTQITDNELAGAPDWTGGEVVIRKNRWIIDRHLITAYSGNTITYAVGTANVYTPTDHYGYFIQNNINTLDQPGEWYFDPNQKKLMLFCGGNNPAPSDVKASVVNILVFLHNQSNIEFDNLIFTGANQNAFDIYNAQYIHINNCDISFTGVNAISTYVAQNLTIENGTIQNTNNDAFIGNDCSNTIIRNNIINNTGLFPGMGKSNDDAYQGIIVRGTNNLVANNQVDSTGYIPIRFEGDSDIIKNNFVNYFTLIKDDGAGIYTWTGSSNTTINYGRKITGNIILNGAGAGEGTADPSNLQSHGIYLDDNSGGVEVTSNTIAQCSKSGIYSHDAHEIIMANNTLFNNGKQLLMIHEDAAPDVTIKNNTVLNNILFSKQVMQFASDIESIDSITNFGTFNNNYYCRPMDDHFVIYNSCVKDGKNFTDVNDLQSWKSVYNKDNSSQKSPVQIPYYTINNLTGTNMYNNGNFNNDIGGLYAWSSGSNCTASWCNNENLDGGALKVSFNSTSETNSIAYVVVGIGAVNAGSNYIVRFSLSGSSANQHLGIFLRQSLGTYSNLTDIKYCAISNTRSDHEFLFTASATESNASLVFYIQEQNSPVYIDNILVQQANVTVTNPDDYIRFEYNPTNNVKTIVLDGTYVDVQNKRYAGNLKLDPYTSVVLMKQPTVNMLPLSFLNFNGSKADKEVGLEWTTGNEVNTSYFEVEKSIGGVVFTTMGRVASNNLTSEINKYTYADGHAVTGNNYYRIKQVDKDGKYTYSKVIVINYSGAVNMIISPNPAKDRVQISFNGLQHNQTANLLIRSVSGITVKTVFVSAQSQHIAVDISSLSSGIYFANLLSEDVSVNQLFVKN